MNTQYLLPCQCGQVTKIDAAQAGRIITCQCGQTIEVPTLRGIRRLPRAQADAPESPTVNWTVQQGSIFAFGVLLATVALGFGTYFLPMLGKLNTAKPRFEEFNLPDDHSAVTPEQAWDFWQQAVADGLGRRPKPQYLADRRRARQLKIWIGIAAGLALTGAVVASSAFFIRPRPQR